MPDEVVVAIEPHAESRFGAPSMQPQTDAVNKLQTIVSTGASEQNRLQDRLRDEARIHDGLHSKMLAAESEVITAISKAADLAEKREQRVRIVFKSGKEGSLFGPKFKVKGKKTEDSKTIAALDAARKKYEEYKQKWASHKGSDKRLASASKALETQERETRNSALRLERAQQAIAVSAEKQAKLAETRAEFATKAEKAKFKTAQLVAKKETRETQAAIGRAKKEQIESERSLKDAKKAEKKRRQADRQMRQLEKEELRLQRAARKSITAPQRHPEVHVRRHQRRPPPRRRPQ